MILKILKEVYEKKIEANPSKAKESKSWRSSAIGSCKRGQLLGRLFSGEFTVNHDQRTLEVFELGNMIEEKYLVDLNLHDDYIILTQCEMYDPNLNNSGHLDALVIHKKTFEAFITDFKSKNSRSFSYMDGKKQGAMHHHLLQVYSYIDMVNKYGFSLRNEDTIHDIGQWNLMNEENGTVIFYRTAPLKNQDLHRFLLDHARVVGYKPMEENNPNGRKKEIWQLDNTIKEGSVVYVSKDDQRKLEYPVMYPDTSLELEYYTERRILNQAWEMKNIVIPPEEKNSWQIKYCMYCKAGLCEKLDNPDVVDSLKEVVAENKDEIKQEN